MLYRILNLAVCLLMLTACAGNSSTSSCADSSGAIDAGEETCQYGVDLGLSVNWSDHNVGAETPDDPGYIIALGNVNGTIKAPSRVKTNISGTDQDIAMVKWGDGWRMPTGPEFQELFDKCEWKSEKLNGRNGFKVIGPNGNSIFLPVTGQAFIAKEGSHYDIVLDKPGLNNNEGNYWFASRANDRFGCNHLTFDTNTGEVKMMIAENYFIMSVRPVHD